MRVDGDGCPRIRIAYGAAGVAAFRIHAILEVVAGSPLTWAGMGLLCLVGGVERTEWASNIAAGLTWFAKTRRGPIHPITGNTHCAG